MSGDRRRHERVSLLMAAGCAAICIAVLLVTLALWVLLGASGSGMPY